MSMSDEDAKRRLQEQAEARRAKILARQKERLGQISYGDPVPAAAAGAAPLGVPRVFVVARHASRAAVWAIVRTGMLSAVEATDVSNAAAFLRAQMRSGQAALAQLPVPPHSPLQRRSRRRLRLQNHRSRTP